MTRSVHCSRSPGAFLGALAFLGLAACGGPASEPEAPARAPVESAAEPPPSPYAAFPANTEFLFRVSIAPLRDSALWQKHGDLLWSQLGVSPADARDMCGFDPLDELEHVTLGGTTANPNLQVVVVRGLSREQVAACLEGAAAADDESLSMSGDGAIARYRIEQDEFWVGWIDDETLVTRSDGGADEAWLSSRVAGEGGLAEDAPLAKLARASESRGPGFWAGLNPAEGSALRQGLAANGAPVPETVDASVAVTETVVLDVTLDFASVEAATGLRDQLQQMLPALEPQLGELGFLVQGIQLDTDGASLLVGLELAEEDLRALAVALGVVGGGANAPADGDTTTTKAVRPEAAAQGVRPPEPDDLAAYTEDLEGEGPLTATLQTSEGAIRCRLFEDEVPMTVANFVGLARGLKPWVDPDTGKVSQERLYDGTIFHRVIPEFMIQGGDPMGTGRGGPGYRFDNEISDSLAHDEPGTLAMANAGPDTNGSQFFITETPQPRLDGDYTVFGRCGNLDVVKGIARVETARAGGAKPAEDVVLESVTIARGEP